MFHPVGSQPPSVYWRRRLVLGASLVLLVVLLVLTVRAVTSGDGGSPSATGTGGASSAPGSTSARPTTKAASTSRATSATPRPSTSAARSSSSTAAPPRCQAKDLLVQAVVGKPSYHVGDQPVVELQVTNIDKVPCVQDLADKQIELRVYNGESRVWGSHDCEIQPGTDDRTLAVARPVRVSVTWSGLTSQPGCGGTRQRVGAGTYTLYATLSGHQGKAARFTIG